jgi:hypothetical protein
LIGTLFGDPIPVGEIVVIVDGVGVKILKDFTVDDNKIKTT